MLQTILILLFLLFKLCLELEIFVTFFDIADIQEKEIHTHKIKINNKDRDKKNSKLNQH